MFSQTATGFLFFIVLSIAFNVQAKKKYYPELQVSPLASQRLAIENKEANWLQHSSLLIPATTTLLAGLTAKKKNDDSSARFADAQRAAIFAGGSSLVAVSLISWFYHPYQTGLQRIDGIPTKTSHQRVSKERLAEEALDEAAYWIKRTKWITAIVNTAASIYLASQGDNTTATISTLSALTSISSLFFSHHWQKVSKQQKEYKKRIYGPIFGVSMLTSGNQITPGVGLNYSF